jgi:hypothetical protein
MGRGRRCRVWDKDNEPTPQAIGVPKMRNPQLRLAGLGICFAGMTINEE